MDVLSIEKTGEHFRLLLDVKGRFVLKKIKEDESKFKLCKIKRREVGPNKIPYIITNDGRSLRFPNPEIDAKDTIKLDLTTNKIVDHVRFEVGNVCYIIGGNNSGRVGIITVIDHHNGGYDIIHVKDANNKSFATRTSNVFVIGKGKKPWITLPKDNGLYLNALE